MNIGSVLDFIVSLATGLIEAFAKAITDYPLVTVVVLIVVYAYLHERRYLVLIDLHTRRLYLPDSGRSWLALFVGFIVVVITANVIGWLFDIIFSVIGKIIDFSGFLVSSFDENPLEFSLSFLGFSFLGFLYLWLSAGWRIGRISIIRLAVVGFIVLFCSYVSTSIVVSLTGATQNSPTAEES